MRETLLEESRSTAYHLEISCWFIIGDGVYLGIHTQKPIGLDLQILEHVCSKLKPDSGMHPL